jgi:hypothetical protein
MNDEASVHYTATIDQMSEGLMWLRREVGGPAPTIAWQVRHLASLHLLGLDILQFYVVLRFVISAPQTDYFFR